MTADDKTTGPVWRDRGTIIANQQARIAELEAEVRELRLKHGPALFEQAMTAILSRAEAAEADAAGLRARMLRLADARDVKYPAKFAFGAAENHVAGYRAAQADFRAALAAEPTPAAEPHAEDGAKGRVMTMHTFFHDTHHDRPQVGCSECFPAPVADLDDTKDGQR